MNNIPTPHISCIDKSKIAKIVLMPGDPLRAKYIAQNYLTDFELFTDVRNILGYTGYYNGNKISVMGSGMGMPSIGIYSYELFSFYDVDTIIRIGSAGSYDENVNVYDTLIVKDAYSESSFAKVAFNDKSKIMKPSKLINNKLKKAADKLGISYKYGRIHSSDVFYGNDANHYKDLRNNKGCLAVEMESFALFANAKALGKNAACLLTISDSLVNGVKTTSLERERNFNNMIKIALELANN